MKVLNRAYFKEDINYFSPILVHKENAIKYDIAAIRLLAMIALSYPGTSRS